LSSSDEARLSVALVDVADGRASDFHALAADFEALLIRKNYGRADMIRDEAHPLRFYAVRHWNNAQAAEQCHADPEVQAITARLYQIARVTHIVNGARRAEAPGALHDRRVRVDVDRRSGFDRRSKGVAAPAGGERRRGTDRRGGARRSTDRRAGADLVAAARQARDFAQAAFSKFKVGAALETSNGTVITGCNVENATYGLTVCAERVAMFKALSEGHRAFTRIAIVADTDEPTPPCGACRQILWEFAGDLEIQLANLTEAKGTHRLRDLLPLPFDARLL
jgi:cytidine deaminase